MSGRLNGKVAVITGAGSGMGAAMVEAFCAEGAKVVAADISGKQNALAERIGSACYPVQVDVSDGDSIQAMLASAIKQFGRLDILCNNAGIQGAYGKTADYDLTEFDRVWATNGRGVFMGMKYAIPLMLKTGGGSIINTSSMAALVVFPAMPAYSASKAAVSMLTKLTAAEYAAENIRVNAILPGAIDTGMTQAMPSADLAAAVKATPMGRIGRPSEIANLAVFFASDESSFVTGTLVPVDGGYTLL